MWIEALDLHQTAEGDTALLLLRADLEILEWHIWVSAGNFQRVGLRTTPPGGPGIGAAQRHCLLLRCPVAGIGAWDHARAKGQELPPRVGRNEV